MFFFFKQKTAYDMRISDWSSDVCSSDLVASRTLVKQAISAEPATTLQRSPPWSPEDLPVEMWEETSPIEFRQARSEERRAGKECVSTCRSRCSPDHSNKNKQTYTAHKTTRKKTE